MKSKKAKAIIALAIVWLLAFAGLMNTWKEKQEEETDIVTAFASGNYINTNGTVSVYAAYGNKYLSEEDKKELISKIAMSVGIDGDLDIKTERQEKEDGSGATSVSSYSCVTNSSATDIRIVTIENKAADNSISLEQYIMMDLSIDNSLDSAVYYEGKLREAFEKMNISADITISLKGCVKGTLSNSKKNEISEDIIEKLGGKLVIGSSSDDVFNVYAYSDSIKDYVVNGTTKSNINIVMTYDSNADVTWIYVATPILSENY